MVEVKASLWKVNCMSSSAFGFGICRCESHAPVIETNLAEIPSLDLPTGMFEAFINHYNYNDEEEIIISIPLKKRINLYNEETVVEELRIRLINK